MVSTHVPFTLISEGETWILMWDVSSPIIYVDSFHVIVMLMCTIYIHMYVCIFVVDLGYQWKIVQL